ncbi:ABC transporter ATP-binding protein [Desulfoluna spongiiphila]|uniref:ABC-2 type transport system ATP-binding protein n=1 Tax=Desulfoluna spongiiphila TaxID=419481 RepID=A0A1G5JEG1_9BACT|nr:ABC transporter ATP-binding protein [Desulfoluna spongiiphila]SCY86199.1 ABC-2 type transport system ATP-binding protein [Desulfoluna spongiiphila]
MILALEQVSKRCKGHFWSKDKTILSDISLRIDDGQVIGIIGHNGAGKTTLFKLITGLVNPDRGQVVFGQIMGTVPRERIGFLPENPYFYSHLTAHESLRFYASLFPNLDVSEPDITKALVKVGLAGRVHHQRLNSYSKGMLQRFGFAQALINDPKLVILDEPMSGLDPSGRRDIRKLIDSLRTDGKTIIFSSHILDDVEKLCDSVVLLSEGKLMKSISLDFVAAKCSWSVEYVLGEANGQDDSVVREFVDSKQKLHDKIEWVIHQGGTIDNIDKVIPPLEEWAIGSRDM